MKYTIKDFQKDFKTDEKCLNFIFNQRYPDGGTCACGKTNCFYPVTGRRTYACSHCGKQISPTEGTIFHKSPTSLRSWFFAMFLMSASKNGVSAKELERQIGVTYKCAWRMAHQIRKLMADKGDMLSGVVEADETYIGPKHPGHRGTYGKAPIVGVLQRGGNVQAVVSDTVSGKALLANIQAKVSEASIICTDEFPGYKGVRHAGYIHETVNHKQGEYVRGIAHTNSLDGFWSQLKRSINGTFHQVSRKHLQNYVNEF